jgi:hypothetical protein
VRKSGAYAPGVVRDTSCMKALRCVKSFEGFLLLDFFAKMGVGAHHHACRGSVVLLSGIGGDGREFSFHL